MAEEAESTWGQECPVHVRWDIAMNQLQIATFDPARERRSQVMDTASDSSQATSSETNSPTSRGIHDDAACRRRIRKG